MKTFLIAILMFTGLMAFAPSAEAGRRYYRDGGRYYSRGYYHSGHRHYYPRRAYYPRYYSRSYYRPYYYRSYYRPYYRSYPSYGYGYYSRPRFAISFGF